MGVTSLTLGRQCRLVFGCLVLRHISIRPVLLKVAALITSHTQVARSVRGPLSDVASNGLGGQVRAAGMSLPPGLCLVCLRFWFHYLRFVSFTWSALESIVCMCATYLQCGEFPAHPPPKKKGLQHEVDFARLWSCWTHSFSLSSLHALAQLHASYLRVCVCCIHIDVYKCICMQTRVPTS